jgi:hypothetical protein
MTTVLIPAAACNSTLDRIKRPRDTNENDVRAYRCSGGDQVNYVFFVDEPRRWQFGPWTSDARFLAFSTNTGQDSDQIIICDGSYLVFDGQQILNCQTRFSSREVVVKKKKIPFASKELAIEVLQHLKSHTLSSSCLGPAPK